MTKPIVVTTATIENRLDSIQDGTAHGKEEGGRVKRPSPCLKSVIHIFRNYESWHSYSLTREDPKNIKIKLIIPWVLLTPVFFFRY